MKTQRMTCSRQRGFTLLELLVVAMILVLLAGVVTVMVTKRMEEAKKAKAIADISSLENAIEQYEFDTGSLPTVLADLHEDPDKGNDNSKWNGPYIKKAVPSDPWGNEYNYVVPGEVNTDSYDLFSLGRDGKEGGEGSDADISNADDPKKE